MPFCTYQYKHSRKHNRYTGIQIILPVLFKRRDSKNQCTSPWLWSKAHWIDVIMSWSINKHTICTDKAVFSWWRFVSESNIFILKHKCNLSNDCIIPSSHLIMFPLSHEGKFPIYLTCWELNQKFHLNSSHTVPSTNILTK